MERKSDYYYDKSFKRTGWSQSLCQSDDSNSSFISKPAHWRTIYVSKYTVYPAYMHADLSDRCNSIFCTERWPLSTSLLEKLLRWQGYAEYKGFLHQTYSQISSRLVCSIFSRNCNRNVCSARPAWPFSQNYYYADLHSRTSLYNIFPNANQYTNMVRKLWIYQLHAFSTKYV